MAKELNMNFRIFAILLFLSALFLSACNDPTALGSDLLDEDRANVGFIDTYQVEAHTEDRDPIQVYSGFENGQLLNLLFGNFNDPVFGRSTSTINAQLFPTSTNPGFTVNNGIDSVILFLPYNILGSYGNVEETYGMDVHELDERLRVDETYLSDYEAIAKPEVLGSFMGEPKLDSTQFIVYSSTDPDTIFIPHMSVSLSASVAENFISLYEQDSTFFSNDSLFLANFNGLQLKPTTENSGMLNFSMFDGIAGMYVFYKDTADVSRSFRFTFNVQDVVASFPQYTHDYSGSIAEPYVGKQGEARDSLLFIQGMAGLEAHIELPTMDELQGTIINKAELEFFIREFSTGDTIYVPSSPLVLTTRDENGSLSLITDAARTVDNGLLAEVFGGVPVSQSSGPTKYRMNLTAHIQDVIDGREGSEMIIIPLGKSSTATRVVLYGADHPDYGIKLSIAFTEL